MKTMNEIFEECLDSCDTELQAKMKFIVEVKKEIKDVSVLEVRKHLGYFDVDDKNKDNALSQKFNLEVFHPVRNFVSKKVLGITDEQAANMWSRSATEELKNSREEVAKYLPKRTRTSSKQKVTDLSFIDLDF